MPFGFLTALETDGPTGKVKYSWGVAANVADQAQSIVQSDALTPIYTPPPPEPIVVNYTQEELKAEALGVDSLAKARALLGKFAQALGGQIPKP